MHESFDRRRKLICEELDKTGIPYIKPEGAFYVFLDITSLIGKKYNDKVISCPFDMASVLLSEFDVAVIPCESFGNDVSIRLSYAISDADIVKGVTRIGKFVSLLK